MALFDAVRLSQVESGRANNLKLLRFLLATGVVFSHCYVLQVQMRREPMQRFFHFSNLGEIAVFGFFFLSGYLILKSGLRWSTPDDFLAARCLRIFPALWCTVLLCVAVVGPAMTSLSLRDYATAPLTRHYLLQTVLRADTLHGLPGVFSGRIPFDSINQPLWTLSSEWLMYVVVLIICVAIRLRQGLRFRWRSWLFISLVLVLTAQMLPFQPMYTLRWAVLFALGGTCFLLREYVRLNIPVAVVLMSASLLLLRIAPHTGKPLFPLALCYAIAVAGYHPALYVRWFNRLGDYSYGIYIYGWPIQQVLLTRASGSPVRLFALAFPCILVMAGLSWHLLEERALQCKPSKRKLERRLEGSLVTGTA